MRSGSCLCQCWLGIALPILRLISVKRTYVGTLQIDCIGSISRVIVWCISIWLKIICLTKSIIPTVVLIICLVICNLVCLIQVGIA